VLRGSKLSRLGSGRIYALCVIHPWPLLGLAGLEAVCSPAMAALGGAACRRRAPFWPRNGFAASNSSAKQTGKCRGPHRGSSRPDCAAQRAGGEVVRRSRAALAEKGAAGLLLASGWHGSMPGITVKQVEGSAGSGVPRRRENRAAESLPAALKFCYGGARQGLWKSGSGGAGVRGWRVQRRGRPGCV